MKTGIIIPCYNEEARLNSTAFLNFIQSKDEHHLCFVNDGSSDNTMDVLMKIKDQAPTKVSVLNLEKNKGKATAVSIGARHFFNHSDIDYIGFLDADLSTDFKDFEILINTLKENRELSVVFGSRSEKSGTVKRAFFRGLFSKMIKSLVYLILGLPINDTQCGAKVFRKNSIPIIYNAPFLCKWLFDVEIFIRLKKHYGNKEVLSKISEQTLMRWEHVDDSKLGFKDAVQIPIRLFNIWFSYNLMNNFKTIESVDKVYPLVKFNNREAESIAA